MRGHGAVTGLDNDGIVSRAQGCLLGQLAGDALALATRLVHTP